MSETSRGWLYFNNDNDADADNTNESVKHNVPSLAERDIASSKITESKTSWSGANITSKPALNIYNTNVSGHSVIRPVELSIEQNDLGKTPKYMVLSDSSSNSIHNDQDGVGKTMTMVGSDEQDPDDGPKNGMLLNVYVGSLTIIGLYIFFRVLKKSR
jgi:hypothetical protein